MAKTPETPEPPLASPEDVLERARRAWRTCLFLPFLYIGVAALIQNFFFQDQRGFWPMKTEHYNALLIFLGCVLFSCQGALFAIRMRSYARLRRVRLLRLRVAEIYYRRTLWMAVFSDLPSGLGLIVFLVAGRWEPLIACLAFSYLLYAQSYPRGRYLEEEPGRPRKGGRSP